MIAPIKLTKLAVLPVFTMFLNKPLLQYALPSVCDETVSGCIEKAASNDLCPKSQRQRSFSIIEDSWIYPEKSLYCSEQLP
jgi:hypothetical protein